MPRYPGFIGPSYQSASVVAADDQTINWIPAKIETPTGVVSYVFDPAPGLHAISSALDGECRGSLAINREGYFVMGGHVYRVDGDPTAPTVTDILTVGGGGLASLASNGDGGHQIVVTNGSSDLYWYDTTTTASGLIATVTGYMVAYLNGYFLLLDVASSKLYVSALLDGTSWDPGDVAQRTDVADRWQAMIVRNQEVLLFGSQTTSVYYNDPTSDFPFVPNLNVTIPMGIGPFAGEALKLVQGTPIWLANDLTVRMLQSYTPVRISNHALEYILSQCITDNAYAANWTEQGHTLYALTLPNAYLDARGRPTRVVADAAVIGITWVYDVTTGLWHEEGNHRTGVDVHGQAYDLFGTMGVAHAIMIPDSSGGLAWPAIVGGRFGTDATLNKKLYVLSQNYTTEADGTTAMTRRRRAPNLVSDLKLTRYANFQLFAETGVIASTPSVTLQWSNDGAQTFNTGTAMSAGALSDYTYRILARGSQGMARNRSFQVTTASPLRLLDAYVDMSVGAS